VTSRGHREITVTVRAMGLDPVKGNVTIVNAHGVRRTLALAGGTVTFSPQWLHAGKRRITVVYDGSRRVDGRTVTRTLAVQ
jgi:hypothetical protein